MNGFGNWLRNVSYKLRIALQRFMAGRYGTDKLNMAILCTGLAFSLLASFLPGAAIKLLFTVISYGFMIVAIFRTLSRNIPARRQELQKYLAVKSKCTSTFGLWKRMWAERKTHCYFHCPQCKAMLRVPKHRGEIVVTCPRCSAKTDKKT